MSEPLSAPTPSREPLPAVYTVAELARTYHIGPGTISRAIKSGELKAGKLGKRYVVTPASAAAWFSRVNP